MDGAAYEAGRPQFAAAPIDHKMEADFRAEIQELRATVEELHQRLEEKDATVCELRKQLEAKPSEVRQSPRRSLGGGGNLLSPFTLSTLGALPEDRPRGESMGNTFDMDLSHSLGTAEVTYLMTGSHALENYAPEIGGGVDSVAISDCTNAWYRGASVATENVVMELQSHIRAMEAQLALTQIDQEELSAVRTRNIELERMVESQQVPRQSWYAGLVNSFCASGERSAIPTFPAVVDIERRGPSPPAFSGLE